MGLEDLAKGIPVVGGLISMAAPLVAAKMGVGKNTTNVTDFGRTTQYDPNATRYGRTAGAADATANRFAGLAGDAQNRGAAQADYGRANDWDAQGQYARQAQGNVANLMMTRATGATPSIAQMQADRQMQQAAAAQGSAAAGARGAAGLALAGQAGAGNLANAQSAIANQAQINAANERMQAEQAASNAYTGMRTGDQNATNTAAQMAQYQAQLEANQRAQNDTYANQMYTNEADVRRQDLTGGINNQSVLGTTFTQGQGQRADVGQANANREMEYYKGFMGGVGGAADAGTKMGMANQPMPAMPAPAPVPAAGGGPPPLQMTRAHGGPVSERRPYLVGEQGPELIVPRNDGYVLTNDQTRQAVARAYGGPIRGARANGGFIDAVDGKDLQGGYVMAPGGGIDVPATIEQGASTDGLREAYKNPKPNWETEVTTHDVGMTPMSGLVALAGARAYGGPVRGYYPARAMGGPVSAGGMSPLEALLGGGAYGGVGGSSGPAMASYDRLNPDMSMDVQGSLQAHSDAATRYGRDPTGGMQGGGLMGGGY